VHNTVAGATLRERISAAAGSGSLLPAEMSAEFAVRAHVPTVVAAPESAEQAAAILSLCTEEGWLVECVGAGTWLRRGRTPDKVDVVLSTRRMKGVSEYVPADLTVGVRAGTALDDLRVRLAEHRQFAPLDGPAATGATTGAFLATASAGPLRVEFGTPRDQALGIEVVTGDGRVLHFGGRVVKNVAGYDVVRLMVGSHGTLGLITAAHLRLRGMPERDVTLALHADEAQPLLEAANAAAALEPSALELVHGAATGGTNWHLLARIRGSADAVADAATRMSNTVTGMAPLDAARAGALWQQLANAEAESVVSARVSNHRAQLGASIATAMQLAGDGGLPSGWTIAAHAAAGIVRVFASEDLNAAQSARFAEHVNTARNALAKEGGSLTVPVLPGHIEAGFEPYAVDAALLPLMRRLKDAFDPAGILSPGRLFL
jgi:glycolate oxidase FAD binding subunit